MSKPQDTTVVVCDVEQYDGDWPTPEYPTLLVEAVAWFNRKLSEIPEQYHANAICEIVSASGYEDSHYGRIKISYKRPETDEEMARRIVNDEARERHNANLEIAQLRKLQAKYQDVT